jgi:acetyl-CoA carboxylase biotin carboxyl carrier protein
MTPDSRYVASTLALIRESAMQVVSAFPRPPSTLRVSAGDVTLELGWPAGVAPDAQVRDETPGPVSTEADQAAAAFYIRAPAVGVFHRSPEPGAPPFVAVGDTVSAGQQVAIVEIMKLFMPVLADVSARIDAVHPSDGTAVEHDEPLFSVTPSPL